MTLERIARMRRKSLTDLLVVAALGAVVGIEIASLASATPALGRAPSGLVIDARDRAPHGLAIAAPAATTAIDGADATVGDGDRIAAGERAATTAATTL